MENRYVPWYNCRIYSLTVKRIDKAEDRTMTNDEKGIVSLLFASHGRPGFGTADKARGLGLSTCRDDMLIF